jgi:hypothetical protein
MRQIDFTFGLGARQQQVHQRVVRQIQQPGQRIDVVVGQFLFVRIQEARQDQVVFEQTPAGAPAQARAVGRVGLMRELMRYHTRVRCWVNIIRRLPDKGSTVLILYLFLTYGTVVLFLSRTRATFYG